MKGTKKITNHKEITCDMCSAAATLGLTTSQLAMTRVFGTLPSVWIKDSGTNQQSMNRIHQHGQAHIQHYYAEYIKWWNSGIWQLQ